MEATGRLLEGSPYYALEGLFDELWLCNAAAREERPGPKERPLRRGVAGRRRRARHGAALLRPAAGDPRAARAHPLPQDPGRTPVPGRSSAWRRCSKTPGIKLTSVASAVWSVSSREIIEALIAGTAGPDRPRPDGQGQDAREDRPSSKRRCRVTSAPTTRSSAARSSTTSTSSTTRSPRSPRRSPPGSSLLRRRSPS